MFSRDSRADSGRLGRRNLNAERPLNRAFWQRTTAAEIAFPKHPNVQSVARTQPVDFI